MRRTGSLTAPSGPVVATPAGTASAVRFIPATTAVPVAFDVVPEPFATSEAGARAAELHDPFAGSNVDARQAQGPTPAPRSAVPNRAAEVRDPWAPADSVL